MIAYLLACTIALAAPPGDAAPRPLVWNTSLVAQGIRPGGKVGLDLPLLETRVVHEDRRPGRRTVTRFLVLEPSLTAWHHPHNLTPVTAGSQLIYRLALSSGWQREVFVGQGVTYAFNADATYVLRPSGKLEKIPLAGHWMSATSVGVGVGQDRARLAWHVRPTLTIWAPYSTGIAPVVTAELGMRKSYGGTRR